MLLDRVLLGLLYAFIFTLKGVALILGLPGRLIRGYDQTADDARLRRAVIERKARQRWIHDVEAAQRLAKEAQSRTHTDADQPTPELTATK